MQLTSGDHLGSYEILDRLGKGGMGEVYRARDIHLGREVAIKVINEEASRNESRLKRFIAEAKATSALNHPNILTVYGIGEQNDSPYIITELVEGRTLRALLSEGQLPLEQTLDYIFQTLAGLSKAHSIGIVHRDLKPENLMITRDGFVKILDFGLAKLLKDEGSGERPLVSLEMTATETGLIMGTAAYMSPEQARGQHADVRADLFSAGVILYEMLSGRNPFLRTNPVTTLIAILQDEPSYQQDLGSFPPQLRAIVEKALQKEPENRYSSAREMELDLRPFKEKSSASMELPTVLTATPAELKSGVSISNVLSTKSRKPIIAAAMILILLASGSLYLSRTKPAAVSHSLQNPVIAVMAFENQTSDPELMEIGRILADSMVQTLYNFQGVQTVSPLRIQSILSELGKSYSDTAKDVQLVREVSKRAGANVIFSGSISEIGGTYVLNATLTEISNDQLIGSYRAETREKQNLLASMTTTISQELRQTFTGASRGTLIAEANAEGPATQSFEAYASFIRGCDLVNEGKWKQAVDELQKAIQIDPKMAVAWSQLACAYSFGGDDARSTAAQKTAEQLKNRLNRKDRLWVETNSLWLDGNGKAYIEAQKRYIQEFPDDREGYFYTGLAHQWLEGNCKEAQQWYNKARELTPNYYPITKAMVDCFLETNQKDQAIAALERYLQVTRSGYGHNQAKQRLSQLRS